MFIGETMRKAAFLLVFVFTIFSCANGAFLAKNGPAAIFQGKNFLDTVPDRELIFVGVAGVRMNKDESIQLALEDAAKKAAFYDAVGGAVSYYEKIGGGFFDYTFESQAVLNYDQNYKSYIDALEYDPERDVFTENNAVFVRVRYTGGSGFNIEHRAGPKDLRPDWIANPPSSISGFIAGVGYANPRYYHKDTVVASYENAVFAIINNISSAVQSETISAQNTDSLFSSSSMVKNTTNASGFLKGFYVLETWVDPSNRAVWTLAVAREGR
jgi:hypothetical protein